ncbi:hypothetical protein [Halopenitus malekzadehii]|uniref:hypothetical protein n=1 Tax=Halopenitus malekzadehii TaxID=1267564 RepID=UPI00115F84A7|nr:hypothetical protein [Halopenitus malekzadehii]
MSSSPFGLEKDAVEDVVVAIASAFHVDDATSPSREDLRLALIPALFIGIYGVGRLAMGPTAIPAAGASLVCGLLIADGLFWHSPRRL